MIAAAWKDLERNPRDNWSILVLGMNLGRAGRFAEAMSILDRSRPDYRQAVPLGGMRAIVLRHLGRKAEAKIALADADRGLEQAYREALAAGGPTLIPLPFELVLLEVIRREAHALIEGKPAADDPYLRLVRARVLMRMGRDGEAEKEIAAAGAARPDDPLVVAAIGPDPRRARPRAARPAGMVPRIGPVGEGTVPHPDDAALLGTRAELLAGRGEWDRGARTWPACSGRRGDPTPVVRGRYVGRRAVSVHESNHEADRARAQPPESHPDPSRPPAGPDGKSTLGWKAVIPTADGFIDLRR